MKLEFTHEQLTVLDQALRLLPWGVVNPLFIDINRQLAEQKPNQPAVEK